MNSKGVAMIKMILFLIGSLIVGALVIFGFSSMVSRLMVNAEEQIAAKDIGLTIMTVSASPNDIVYRYDKNTENYDVRITENEVQVSSKTGSGKYRYIQMVGVTVENALIQNALMIPLTLKGGKMSFADDKISYSDVCSQIPSNFDGQILKVKATVSTSESFASAQKLEEIKALMKIFATDANSRIEFVESDEELLLVLETGSSPEIKYYANADGEADEGYHKIACYITSGINSEENVKTALGTSSFNPSSEESITINFGDSDKFIDELNKDPKLSSKLAAKIYSALGLGISD